MDSMHLTHNKNPITGRQIAAARTLAGLGQDELARRAKISLSTLRRIEASIGAAAGFTHNVNAVIAALEAEGIEFATGSRLGVLIKVFDFANECC